MLADASAAILHAVSDIDVCFFDTLWSLSALRDHGTCRWKSATGRCTHAFSRMEVHQTVDCDMHVGRDTAQFHERHPIGGSLWRKKVGYVRRDGGQVAGWG
jgi:hypothetical protein